MNYPRLFLLSAMAGGLAFGHCDNLDGPVVQAARKALTSGDVSFVLPWIGPEHESTVRDAFRETWNVRKLSAAAERVADTWFLETVVRVHRQGEGAPYDGLKAAGTNISPAIAAADRAVQTGAVSDVRKHIIDALGHELDRRFQRLQELRAYKPADVKRGREYVAAYVDFIHFVERMGQAAAHGSEGPAQHEH